MCGVRRRFHWPVFPVVAMLACAPFPEMLEVPEDLLVALWVSLCSHWGTPPWLGLPPHTPQLGLTQGQASSRGVHRHDCPGLGSGASPQGWGRARCSRQRQA